MLDSLRRRSFKLQRALVTISHISSTSCHHTTNCNSNSKCISSYLQCNNHSSSSNSRHRNHSNNSHNNSSSSNRICRISRATITATM
jgi:hypothetical protein